MPTSNTILQFRINVGVCSLMFGLFSRSLSKGILTLINFFFNSLFFKLSSQNFLFRYFEGAWYAYSRGNPNIIFLQGRGWKGNSEIVFLRLQKNRSSQSLAVKTTCFTQYQSYLNPQGEDSSCKIDGFMATYTSKLEWAWQA